MCGRVLSPLYDGSEGSSIWDFPLSFHMKSHSKFRMKSYIKYFEKNCVWILPRTFIKKLFMIYLMIFSDEISNELLKQISWSFCFLLFRVWRLTSISLVCCKYFSNVLNLCILEDYPLQRLAMAVRDDMKSQKQPIVEPFYKAFNEW